MNAARWTTISPLKIVLAGVLLGVTLAVLVLTFVATEKPAEAAFPGENGKLAFTKDWDIYTVDPDGSNLTNLTNSSALESRPDWSPDGTKIAFTNGYMHDFGDVSAVGISIMDVDGSNVTRLTDSVSSWYGSPAWSPDGTKIAFDTSGDVWTIEPDGSNLTNLTNDSAGYIDPVWSPDGTKIAFSRHRFNSIGNFESDIYVMNADGSNQTNLTNSAEYASNPDWSPDGTKIVFDRSISNQFTTKDIWIMNADGSNQTKLADSTEFGYFSSPTWSPDGTKIAFFQRSEAIWTMNADGSSQTRLPAVGGFGPDWQPLPGSALPATKAQCKQGGYEEFGFKNQGLCEASVQRPAASR
jgi:TolB protein